MEIKVYWDSLSEHTKNIFTTCAKRRFNELGGELSLNQNGRHLRVWSGLGWIFPTNWVLGVQPYMMVDSSD